MVKIKRQLISNTNYKNGSNNPAKFITLHMTGNTSPGADAQAHANLQSNGNTRDASWHWQVDDKQAVQSFDHKFKLWHASDGQGSGNNESIGIEGCVNSDGDFNAMMSNYVDLVVHVMKECNITDTNNIVTHYWWSGKNCPTQMFQGKNGWTFDYFISQVKKELKGKTEIKVSNANKGRSLKAYMKGKIDGLGAEVRKRSGSRKTGFKFNKKSGYDLNPGDVVYIFEVHDGWGRIYTGNLKGNGSNDWIYLDRLNVTEVFK